MKLQTNIENIKANPEDFGKALCDALGIGCLGNWNFSCDTSGCSVCNLVKYQDLNAIFEVQEIVIKKVGNTYINQMLNVMNILETHLLRNSVAIKEVDLLGIATADAPTRLCAMLLALNITEIEVKE